MAIWLDKDSKVIVQGMTGATGMKHTKLMLGEAQLQAAQASLAQAVAQRDELQGGAVEAELAAAEAQLAAAVRDQGIANDTHERTMDCRTVRLPDGTRREGCPALRGQSQRS